MSAANHKPAGTAGFAVASAFVILLSAFLLFQVQPVISKVILPWFGGSPAVWTTCMLFFQVLLLGGYAYAHWLTQIRSAGRQAAIHVGMLAIAILLLPIIPGDAWKPIDSLHPTSRILVLLGVFVGLPYFALSSTGPLVQAWFGRVCVGRSPYWLYALSNIGSLAALLTYPFVFEPMWMTRTQGLIWSVSFAVFAISCGALAIRAWRHVVEQGGGAEATGAVEESGSDSSPPGPLDRLLWLFLPALASTTLLAVTNHLCQDVAVVPFMWVAPLSLYLLTFILCFAGGIWYSRRLFTMTAAVSILLVLRAPGAYATRWLYRSARVDRCAGEGRVVCVLWVRKGTPAMGDRSDRIAEFLGGCAQRVHRDSRADLSVRALFDLHAMSR
jgi:hypothetical protein